MSRAGARISRLRQSIAGRKITQPEVNEAKQIALDLANDARAILITVGVAPAVADQARTRILNTMRAAANTVP